MVADEVRKLAEQSSREANNIAELIKDIQKDTSVAVDSIRVGNQNAKESADTIRNTVDVFIQIESEVETLNQNVAQSISNINEANEVSQQVFNAMTLAQDGCIESSEEALCVAAMAEEQENSMKEIANETSRLSGLVKELTLEMGRFILAKEEPEKETVA